MPLMTDTDMSDEWIARVLAKNPCQPTVGGNYRTCPVRLSFPSVFEKSRPIPPNEEGKYQVNALFPMGADLTLLEDECLHALSEASWYRPGMKGLTMPIKDPAKMPLKNPGGMLEYAGYQEGARYIIATSDNKPLVVDQRLAPITDPAKVYPGVWAIVEIRAFVYNKGVNKGVGFGLQQVMIVADDRSLGGVPPANPQASFGGVQIDAEVNPQAQFSGGQETAEADARKALFG